MRILIVDDEEKLANTVAERLRLRGFDTTAVYDGESALLAVGRDLFDAVVLDLRLPDLDGMEILRRIRAGFPDIRVVILSGHGSAEEFKACLKMGATACFQKPADIKKLAEALAAGPGV